MERTGMTVRRSAIPMIGMLAALLLVLGGSAVGLRVTGKSQGISTGDPALAVDSEATYQDLARAADLLQAGNETPARHLIDRTREEALVVNPGGHGDGALAAFSPTTILMRLGRIMADHAILVAARGDTAGAQAWLERCQHLSGQALATPAPSLAALQVSHYLDRAAGEAQVAILERADGRKQAAARALSRETALHDFWKRVVLRPITSQRHAWSEREWAARPCERLTPETRDREERRFALKLIQVYQRERLQGDHRP